MNTPLEIIAAIAIGAVGLVLAVTVLVDVVHARVRRRVQIFDNHDLVRRLPPE